MGGTAELTRRLGVPIEGRHQDDRFWIDGLPMQSRYFGFPEVGAFVPGRWLEEGGSVTVGNIVLAVPHCPGHTLRHVIFHDARSRLCIVGDVLFQGRTDFPKETTRT